MKTDHLSTEQLRAITDMTTKLQMEMTRQLIEQARRAEEARQAAKLAQYLESLKQGRRQ